MNNTESLDLSNFFLTKAQATDFATRLAAISEQTYQTNFNLEKALLDALGMDKKDKFLTLIRDTKADISSAGTTKAFLDKLRETIAQIPLLPITLAFEPKEQTLKALADWFLMSLNKQVLFDISVDKNLIAGAAITFNGKYLDFSVKGKFDEIVKNALTAQTTTKQQTQSSPSQKQDANNLHLGR